MRFRGFLATLLVLAGCVVPGRAPLPLYVRWQIWVNANVPLADLLSHDVVTSCGIYNPFNQTGYIDYSMEPCKSDPLFLQVHERNHGLQQAMYGWTLDEFLAIYLPIGHGLKYEHEVDCMTEALIGRPMIGGNGYGECAGAEVIALYKAMDAWLN